METKICTKCNVEYPKTDKFFYVKTTKPTKKNKLVNTYYCLKSKCKKCESLSLKDYRNKKASQKLGISIEEYKDVLINGKKYRREIKNQICTKCKKNKNIKFFSFRKSNKKHLTICKKCNNEYFSIYKKARYRTDEEYKKSVLKSAIKQNKKISKEKKRQINKKQYIYRKNNLTNIYIKDCLRGNNLKYSEIPIELIEAKRQSIILKRKLKNHEQPQICN
jgi:hypothetical protein